MEKKYVLQRKRYPWDDKVWDVVPGEYPSIEEAETARLKQIIPEEYRVAEPYIVVRYKPVRGKSKSVR